MVCGLQKMTLLDFPGKVACTVFLGGCNYRCPFCHNSELFSGAQKPVMTDEELLAFLQKRRGLLEGVCISGGEPTLTPNLQELARAIKAMGFAVKLDTNGTRPGVLKALVAEHLVDYVAMDVKNAPEKYAKTVDKENPELAAVEESLRFLIDGNVAYELRTTLVQQLHSPQDMEAMGQWLASLVPGKKPAKLFLQQFVDRDTVAFAGLCAPPENAVLQYADILTPYVGEIALRQQ